MGRRPTLHDISIIVGLCRLLRRTVRSTRRDDCLSVSHSTGIKRGSARGPFFNSGIRVKIRDRAELVATTRVASKSEPSRGYLNRIIRRDQGGKVRIGRIMNSGTCDSARGLRVSGGHGRRGPTNRFALCSQLRGGVACNVHGSSKFAFGGSTSAMIYPGKRLTGDGECGGGHEKHDTT